MPRRLGKNPEIYNIPAHQSFVDVLAKGITERFGADLISLSKVLILLPNRRAVRSLREAFLRLSDGKATILPIMQPIGDVDEDGLIMGGGGQFDALDLEPAVPPFLRQSLLMEIIASWHKKRGEDIPESANRAQLAEALGHLLDQIQTEELSFDDLENIVPEEYSTHWQQTLEFLKILTEHWPNILQTTGYMDVAERRNFLMNALKEKWLDRAPEDPIIAAGSTGSIKATASLLEVIARLPQGMVVLPGLDQNLDDESWNAIADGHPQAMMKALLDQIRADRIEVKNWDGSDERNEHPKTVLFREIMRPAKTTHLWRRLGWKATEILEGIEQVVAPTVREEAGVIALKMREQLEHPGKTAALVTPDRMLARQVSGELKRWGIVVDDSAGTPLFNTPVGTFLRLIIEMTGDRFAPVPLLACLKHPLAAGGSKPGEFRANVRKFEKQMLRGPRPQAGLEGIATLILHKNQAKNGLFTWWRKLLEILEPLEKAVELQEISFSTLLNTHISIAEQLARTNEEDGAARLWKGDDGEAAAQFIEELLDAAESYKPLPGKEYPALFSQLMAGITVRSKYGTHPRLNIWGPLEARLQHADLMILAGLNEGSWPPDSKADPWMSRPMRKDFGLPDLEQKTGLSAHDFVQAASAEDVIITRAEKLDGTPTVKSRWLSRLHAILGDDLGSQSQKWLNWYRMLDKPDHEPQPIAPPSPSPPVSSRPRELSVTRIQLWMQDPYSLYANKILNLNKLDDLDQDPTAIDKGVMIHRILEEFMALYKDELPENAEEELISIGERYFADVDDRPTVMAFWWPRFKQIAKWFVEEEKDRRKYSLTIATETLGEIVLKAPGGDFKLSARADRIDAFLDGGYSVIDYKTGNPPSVRELKAGFAPQLPLEATIAIQNGFHMVKSDKVRELSYWKLSGGETAGVKAEFRADAKSKTRRIDVDQEARKAHEGLLKLVATFDLQETPYLSKPRPQSVGYGEYDHLARIKEWGNG